jgi:transketolase
MASGSEVQLCVTARERLEADGVPTRVESMPCQEWFLAQDQAYQQRVLPSGIRARVSVEAGIAMSWQRLVGDDGVCVSLEHYGASAPYQVLFEQFGFTPDRVVAAARASLAKVGEVTGSTTGN